MSRVLIIEDDAPYRKVYTRKFQVSGYDVETAENGADGLAKMRSFKPDIVFVDLMMPKMDGFQVIDHAKADPELKTIPIIVLTNLSTADDAQKVMQKGALAVLVKSDTEPNAIVAKANEVLSGKQA
jgi:CheY-like chemotaxis protein